MQITQETLAWSFKDADWKNKFIIGSALALASSVLPIIGLLGIFAVYGYALIIMRAVMRGESPTLPKWDKLGELVVDGLKATVTAIGYFVPGILALCCAYVFLFATIFGSASISKESSGAVGVGFLIGQLGYFLLLFGGMVLLFIGAVPTPISVGQYVRTGQITSGYRVREIWTILRANFIGFFLAWALYLGIAMALSYLLMFVYFTIIFCLFLPVLLAPVTFYLALLWATLFGAAYGEAVEKLPELQSSSG